MKILNILEAAHATAPARPDRPAMAVVNDDPASRLIVFRIAPGQSVPPHRNASLVSITVVKGTGTIAGEANGAAVEHPCRQGDLFICPPGELHGMKAGAEELVLLAAITPRSSAQ